MAALNNMSRRSFLLGTLAAGAYVLGGCSSGEPSELAGPTGAESPAQAIRAGTLATEDILPVWVAQAEDLFADEGLTAEVTVFQSATELIAGFASGSVDFAMTDPMVAASMYASGVDLSAEWVTLGETADQGRFGIMTSANSGYTSLEQLAGVPIGVGSNTILEYVMDRLMLDAGVPADQIVSEELQKLPVRYQAMVSGEVAAAALPASLLALGEAQGCVLIADDTQGDNISQSIMIASGSVTGADDGRIAGFQAVWDTAVKLINADGEKYRDVLVANASLSEEVADTYPISTYPLASRPTNDMVDPILYWMTEKGYLDEPLSYDAATGRFA
jgi:NitT/TauT family transport system substrate-binding protein